MKPSSIASADENTEENSEDNSLDNEDFDDLDDNEEDTYDILNNNNSNINDYNRSLQGQQNKYANGALTGHNGNHDTSNLKRKTKQKFDRKRKCRTTFTKNQLNALECEFLKSNFISNDKINSIIEITGLDSRIIKVVY